MAGLAARMVVMALALGLAPAAAGDDGGAFRLAEAGDDTERVSRDRAAEVARAATGGRVLRVELERNGEPWYRVRVLIDGERVRSVAVDARTGRIRE